MIKILITGANSYIGTSLAKWISQYGDEYFVDTVDTIGDEWKKTDFSQYDVVFHVAGIVHIKEKPELESLYFSVNRDLAFSVAEKAKRDGVNHFIFMSTKGVYAPNTPMINKYTVPNPKKLYGKSKLEGEGKISALNDNRFKVSILRPPTVYGENCPGNYSKLSVLVEKIKVFPSIYNERSMIYIWNLCEFVRMIIDNPINETVLFPQNKEYGGSLRMIKLIAKERNKTIIYSRAFGFAVRLVMKFNLVKRLNTMFLDSKYDLCMSDYFSFKYCRFSLEDSIHNIEIVKNQY